MQARQIKSILAAGMSRNIRNMLWERSNNVLEPLHQCHHLHFLCHKPVRRANYSHQGHQFKGWKMLRIVERWHVTLPTCENCRAFDPADCGHHGSAQRRDFGFGWLMMCDGAEDLACALHSHTQRLQWWQWSVAMSGRQLRGAYTI